MRVMVEQSAGGQERAGDADGSTTAGPGSSTDGATDEASPATEGAGSGSPAEGSSGRHAADADTATSGTGTASGSDTSASGSDTASTATARTSAGSPADDNPTVRTSTVASSGAGAPADENPTAATGTASSPSAEAATTTTATATTAGPTEPETRRVTEPETRRMETPRVPPARGAAGPHPVGEAVWRGTTVLAAILRIVGYACALVLVVYVVLAGVGVNPQNGVAQLVGALADTVVLAFRDLFLPADPRLRVVVDYGLAAIFWLLAGAIASRIVRSLGGAVRSLFRG